MDSMPSYRGHSIFRNQPSYTIFNKSFEDPGDAFFLQLNEIDPYFLTPAQIADNAGFSQTKYVDPRTKQEQFVTQYNHSKEAIRYRIFKGGGIKSKLTKFQHVACLRVLLAWQERKEVSEVDLFIWRDVERKRLEEKGEMLKFVGDYAALHKEEIYKPVKRLNDMYIQWYQRCVDSILQLHTENVAFNTHIGLPLVNLCKNSYDEKSEIMQVELLQQKGYVRLYETELTQIEWQSLNFRLETYIENYLNELPQDDSILHCGRIIEELEKIVEDANDSKRFYMPLETILFILTAGNYVDLPTEVLLEIRKNEATDITNVIFETPLPARNCGWHTQQQVVEQAFKAFNSVTGRNKWLNLADNNCNTALLETAEVSAHYDRDRVFKPVEYDAYLTKYNSEHKSQAKLVKHNSALLRFYLKQPESDEGLKILTTLNLPPKLEKQRGSYLAYECIKLEYKPQFGCELLTKYELLRAWLQMRLLSSTSTEKVYGICHRLAASDLDIQLEEQLTLEAIELHLKNSYHVNVAQLTANFAEFLKLLSNMPAGKYLLRYNEKYRDKLLLCAPSKEITQNTVFLHNLLQQQPTDMPFMMQPHFLPIVDTLCSAVHRYHNVLPCAFLPPLPHHTNLQTAASKAEQAAKRKAAMKQQKTPPKNSCGKAKWASVAGNTMAEKEQQRKKQLRDGKRKRARERRKAAKAQATEENTEIEKLLTL